MTGVMYLDMHGFGQSLRILVFWLLFYDLSCSFE